jgi:hypothetical protein
MSIDELKTAIGPKHRPAFGLVLGLLAGASVVLLAAARVDAHIAGIVHAETDARANALDARLQVLERERADLATKQNAHDQRLNGLDTALQVLRAETRGRR